MKPALKSGIGTLKLEKSRAKKLSVENVLHGQKAQGSIGKIGGLKRKRGGGERFLKSV